MVLFDVRYSWHFLPRTGTSFKVTRGTEVGTIPGHAKTPTLRSDNTPPRRYPDNALIEYSGYVPIIGSPALIY